MIWVNYRPPKIIPEINTYLQEGETEWTKIYSNLQKKNYIYRIKKEKVNAFTQKIL